MRGFFDGEPPEQWRRHEVCRMFGWDAAQYDAAPADMVDWALAIEGAKAHVAEVRANQERR